MFLSRGCEYAIQALLYLASRNEEGYISIREISENSDLSFFFLGKIIQKLSGNGLLDSYKGPNGGVKLAKKPSAISVLDVVKTIDGLDYFDRCFIGLPRCDENNPCALHDEWQSNKTNIYKMLKNTTLALLREK